MKLSTFVLVCCFVTACNSEKEVKEGRIGITVLHDITDSLLIHPNDEFPLKLYHLEDDKNTGAIFRITSTTDVVLNPAIEAVLPNNTITQKENENDDPYYREKRIQVFYSQVREALKAYNQTIKDSVKYHYSECFRSICNEIVKLHKNNTESKLIVYSDLQENSGLGTVYTKNGLTDKSLKAIEKVYLQVNLLPQKIENLTVYFIFQPHNRDEDNGFRKMFAIFQKILETHGAKVILQSGNS